MNGDMVWSFRAGRWYGAFGPRTLVVVPPSERPRVAALWELVDEGAGFDEVLDALVADGLSRLPGFVLVSESVGMTRVLVRGAARVELTTDSEVVRVEGDATSTWTERSVLDVVRLRIEVEDGEDGDDGEDGEDKAGDGRIQAGLVRLAGAQHPPVEHAPVKHASAERPPAEHPPAEPAPAGPSAVPLVEPDHDGLTRHPAVNEVQSVGPPNPAVDPAVSTGPVARLLFPDGRVVEVDRPVLVGRAPEATRVATSAEPRIVIVESPRQEISSTHLEIRPGSGAEHGAAVVTDLGSTNGTVVVQPGLPPQELRPGAGFLLVPGSLVDLGDGVSIEVVEA